ncbi:MAG: 1-acyl-sn-glycerol-3-phosphate acyltransferase, partial [Clostridiales bacterium]|nr:1-acyl-sn-glycerol-3-phosphate acyltransferase [Clostridiales bacterium]
MFEVIRFFVKIVFCTFYRVKVMGYDKLPKTGPVLLISNHESMLDMFMIGYRIRRKVCWMAKAEIFEKKIPAKIFTWFKAYPIKRSGNDTGAINTTFSLLKSGEVVGIFPQGHRTRGQGNNLKAKYGAAKIAAETNTIIQPVAIWGT